MYFKIESWQLKICDPSIDHQCQIIIDPYSKVDLLESDVFATKILFAHPEEKKRFLNWGFKLGSPLERDNSLIRCLIPDGWMKKSNSYHPRWVDIFDSTHVKRITFVHLAPAGEPNVSDYCFEKD